MSTRRTFIKQGLFAASALSLFAPGRMVQAATLSNKVVVFLFLLGANDGLNTLVPLPSYDRYKSLRPNVALDRDALLVLPNAPDLGLNPYMGGIYDLYSQGKVAIINGVAPPIDAVPQFDHEGSQYMMQTCDPTLSRIGTPEGWLGRYFTTLTTTPQLGPGIDRGQTPFPVTNTVYRPTSISTLAEFDLILSFDADARRAAYAEIMHIPDTNGIAEFNRINRVEALQASALVKQTTANYVPQATYPATATGTALQDVARLLFGNLGVAGFSVALGGWDTHSTQNDIVPEVYPIGQHNGLLQEISDAIYAFFTDLQAQGLADKVILVTMSDFGRTVNENGNQGTDHGYGSLSFVIGNPVKGGVYNDYPSLDDSQLAFGDSLGLKSDFRSIYATVADRFLGADPVLVAGGSFPILSFL